MSRQNKFASGFCLLISLLPIFVNAQVEMSKKVKPEEILNNVKSSTVVVGSGIGFINNGSGFIYDVRSKKDVIEIDILTSAHVIEKKDIVKVKIPSGKNLEGPFLVNKVVIHPNYDKGGIFVDINFDLAKLTVVIDKKRVEKLFPRGLPKPLQFSNNNLQHNTKLQALGYPNYPSLSIFSGLYDAFYETPIKNFGSIKGMKVEGGTSGGPIIDPNGKVVGICSACNMEDKTYFVSQKTIKDFIYK